MKLNCTWEYNKLLLVYIFLIQEKLEKLLILSYCKNHNTNVLNINESMYSKRKILALDNFSKVSSIPQPCAWRLV